MLLIEAAALFFGRFRPPCTAGRGDGNSWRPKQKAE